MTAIILAGGKSSRMGLDKAFIKIKGVPIIKRQVALLRKLFKKIIIVTNSPYKYKRFRTIKVIQDIIIERGPLGGIYSGLLASDSFYNFVIACDIPFLDLELIRYMINLKNGFDVVVPHLKKGYETVFAIYSKNCIRPISQILNNTDNFKVREFFDKVRLREITEKELKKICDPNILFMNINTKQDLCRISTYLKE